MEKTERVDFKVDINEQDIIDYNMKLAYGRVSTWALMAISIMVVAFVIYALIFKPPGVTIDWTIILTAAFAASYLFILPTMIKLSSKTIFKKNPQFRHSFFYDISDKGIKITVDGKDTIIKWDNLYKFVETPETFLVHVARGRAFIVPKRCLDGDQMIWDIKEIVKENVDMSRLSLKYKTK